MKMRRVFWTVLVAVIFGTGRGSAQLQEEAPVFTTQKAAATPEALATLVVYNRNDPDSGDLARFYMEKRGIPKTNVLGLDCSKAEEISREEYDATIVEPMRRAFTANFWWKLRELGSPLGPVESCKIRFVALMRGMPLKIRPTTNYPGDKPIGPPAVSAHNEAAVDSELSLFGFYAHPISGIIANPYFRSFSPFKDFVRPEMILVCRLDGPTPAIVKRMITDSIFAEENGLPGIAYVDARGITGGGYEEGDRWLMNVAAEARRDGSPVVLDTGPDIFPDRYPMTKAALYFGWYEYNMRGPFTQPEFRFNRGAIAVHIHSFSAGTVRDNVNGWVGPLLSVGAAATLGNVYEPFLALTPQLDVFHNRLREGFTFAESAYMSVRMLSWMTTFVGDPLYRPYKGVLELDEKPSTGEWAEYRKGAKLWFSKDRAAGEAALRNSGRRLRSGVIMEGLGLLQLTVNDRTSALASFEQARQFYGSSDDAVRVATHEVVQLRAVQRERDALALLGKMLALVKQEPSASFLRAMDLEIRAALDPKPGQKN